MDLKWVSRNEVYFYEYIWFRGIDWWGIKRKFIYSVMFVDEWIFFLYFVSLYFWIIYICGGMFYFYWFVLSLFVWLLVVIYFECRMYWDCIL